MFLVYRYRSWVIVDNEETRISDVYSHTASDAKRRAAQRALEALMKKQPSHVNMAGLILIRIHSLFVELLDDYE